MVFQFYLVDEQREIRKQAKQANGLCVVCLFLNRNEIQMKTLKTIRRNEKLPPITQNLAVAGRHNSF